MRIGRESWTMFGVTGRAYRAGEQAAETVSGAAWADRIERPRSSRIGRLFVRPSFPSGTVVSSFTLARAFVG